MNVFPHGFGFLQPLCTMEGVTFVEDPARAEFVLAMNGDTSTVRQAQGIAGSAGIPLCWWSIEDPNGWNNHEFHHQASAAEYVFTSDRECIRLYRDLLGHDRVYWLPLACNPEMERPLPLAEDATDFVFSGNFYPYEARRWCDETVILPLARAGYSMTIYSYQEPPYPELKAFWKGGTSAHAVAEQYRHGRVVLGANNQRDGLDGIHKTSMCSMRVFQALSCGKPFLSPWTGAYEALGLQHHVVACREPIDAVDYASLLFDPNGVPHSRFAEEGRAIVSSHHTYRHRLERISRAIRGEADPEAWV